MNRGAACPDEPPTKANQYQTRCTASDLTPIQPDGSLARICSTDLQKDPAWCMIRARKTGKEISFSRGALLPLSDMRQSRLLDRINW